MASELAMVMKRISGKRNVLCAFICPQCGPCTFEINLEVTPTAKRVALATDLVMKAHQLEHP